MPQSSSISKIIQSHQNSPYLLPLPSNSIISSRADLFEENFITDAASSFLDAHLHSPTLSDNPLSPTGILRLSPGEGFKPSTATNLTFDSLHSPPTKTGHSPPWPQLVSTPSTKPDNLTKSWQPAVNKLGQLVPPQFEPKLELSPPKTYVGSLNATESKITICVQDSEAHLGGRTCSGLFNTTQTLETSLNTTKPVACDPKDKTQTLEEDPAYITKSFSEPQINITQTIEDNLINTTQTLETYPISVIAKTEVPHNTTQTLEVTDIGNTTEWLESDSPSNTTNTLESEGIGNRTQILDDDVQQSTEVYLQNTTQTLAISCQDNSIANHNSPLNTTQNKDEWLESNLLLNVNMQECTQNSAALNRSLDISRQGNSSWESKHSNKSMTKSPVAINLTIEHDSSKEVINEDINHGKILKSPDDPSSSGINFTSQPRLIADPAITSEKLKSQLQTSSSISITKEDFALNSRFTGTYRVTPMLDSEGKKLPGPGVKAGSKISSAGLVQQNNEEGQSKMQLPNFTRSNIQTRSLEKVKEFCVSHSQQGSFEATPELKSDGVKNSSTKTIKTVKPENIKRNEAKPRSNTVGPRLSITMKASSIVSASKATSSEKRMSTQMKPPSVVLAKPPVLNPQVQIQAPKMQPTRFQSRLSFPASARGGGAGGSQGSLRPATSGLRPPSARAASSGIARLTSRQSLSGSRLPLPGNIAS